MIKVMERYCGANCRVFEMQAQKLIVLLFTLFMKLLRVFLLCYYVQRQG